MKLNMMNSDRVIRLLVGLLFVMLYAVAVIPAALGNVLLVSAFFFFATSFVGFCPVYKFTGI